MMLVQRLMPEHGVARLLDGQEDGVEPQELPCG